MKHGGFAHVPIEELIRERKFDYVNPCITNDRFFTPNRLWGNYKEFYFGKNISSDEAVKKMQAEGYEPANSHELLRWERWNEKDPVVALGTVVMVGGYRSVLFLHGNGSGQRLFLRYWAIVLPYGCGFLAVRKPA